MSRKKKLQRKTKETDIEILFDLDGDGQSQVDTGIKFFDHMLDSFAKHGLFNLKIKAQGDIEVDDHHTVEDVGIILGKTFEAAIGDKKGIKRMAHSIVPMDDALATVAIDIGGRSYAVLNLDFKNPMIGDLSTENVAHFFRSFTSSSNININAKVEGLNDHHKIESLFKAFGQALNEASTIKHGEIPSTKGMI